MLGPDQVPGNQALIKRQGFEDESDVGRVHRPELVLQLVEVLAVHQFLDDVVARPLLATCQLLDQLVPGEQDLHLVEALLQVFAIGQLGFFAHGAVPQNRRAF
jgi:hypothetical protein